MNSTAQPRPAAKANQNNRRHRRWIPYAGAALLIALIVAGFWPQPAPVETSRVETGALRVTVNEEGRTRIKNRFIVSAPVAGQLRRIQLKAGDTVREAGMAVAFIEPVTPPMLDARTRLLAQARRDTAAANLDRARAGHAFAASELRRLKSLHADNTVSIQELETAQWREAAAARELAAAESVLREAEAELADFDRVPPPEGRAAAEVQAPIAGLVLRVFEESARVVNVGTPLLELGDPAELEVVIDVLSREAAGIKPGTRMDLEQWGGGEPLLARVRLVEPAGFTKVSALGVEEQRVNVIADFITPHSERLSLGDNYRVEARILVWESEETLKVPSGALFRRGADWGTFVIVNGRARARSLKVGRSSGTEMQVLEGLSAGDEVVLYPGDRVRDGQRVRPLRI
jgi:HlyD family secretion protein